MSDDKRTKFGTGPVAVQPRPVTAQTPSQSQPTEFLQPAGTEPPYVTPVPSPTPSPTPGLTSYTQGVDPMIGATLAGRYLISKKLGEGGMGAVYLATHTLLDKQVALKVLHGEFARKPDLVERFMQEAKAASRIRHENVIDISDFGTTPEGMVFFAMELLKGHDLHEEVARARLAAQLLPWQRSKKIFLQICAALSAAHSHGIVHRDLKPENVYLIEFLGDTDFVKLLDFGIAKQTEVEDNGRKLTKTGMLFGTPEYMSPEQARGEQVDHRVDIYAMGCILFQLVTGRVPFEADNFMGVLTLHLTEPPPAIPVEVFDLIGAPRELADVIDRALQKDRSMRWATIDELANAVRRVCGDPIPTAGAMKAQAAPISAVMNVAAPATTTTQRQRTQWTGSVKVPSNTEIVEAGGGGGSKLPLILGAIAVLGIGGGIAFFALGGKSDEAKPTVSEPVVTPPATPDAQVAIVVDAAPELPPLPERVKIKIDTKPRGAEVRDLAKDRVLGKTPVTLDVKGARDTLSFSITLRNHADVIYDITPDKTAEYVVELERGQSGTGGKRISAPTKPDELPVVKPDEPKPDAGSAAAIKPEVKPEVKPDVKPEVKPDVKPEVKPEVKPPVTDDCPPDSDEPCLKKFP